MIIAQIKTIDQLIAIEPGSALYLKTEPAQQLLMLYTPNDELPPGNDEKGMAVLTVQILDGNADDVTDVLTIGEDPMQVKLLEVEQRSTDEYEWKIYFDPIFKNGFENAIRHFIMPGSGLIGFSEKENIELKSRVDLQRQLLNTLVDLIFDTKQEQIKRFAMPCLILRATENGDGEGSHWVGQPQFPEDKTGSFGCHLRGRGRMAATFTSFSLRISISIFSNNRRRVYVFYDPKGRFE